MTTWDKGILEEKTERLLSETEEILEDSLKELGGFYSLGAFAEMDMKQFQLLKKGFKIHKDTKEMMISYARAIDQLDKKIDDLVDANKRLSEKLDKMMKTE